MHDPATGIPQTVRITARLLAWVLALTVAVPVLGAAQQEMANEEDPYIWLEEVEGEDALAWATERSEATLAELSERPEYQPIYDDILAILTSDDRIPYPSIRGDMLYNFWTDDERPRGIYRRTTWEDYLGGDPTWEVVLDIDALAEAEDVPWSYSGMSCLPPEEVMCLVRLSRGGADAVEIREFDLAEAEFVEDGFFLPEAKGGATWVDENTLLVNTDFGEGSLTTSGYSRIVKRWERGTPLEEAEIVFEGEETDVSVSAGSMESADDRYLVIGHRPSFFDGTMYLYEDGELTKVDIPTDASAFPFQDMMLVSLDSDWEVGGETFTAGSVIATDFDAFMAGERDFHVVAAPTESITILGTRPTKSHLIVTTIEDVKGRLWRYTPGEDGWTKEQIDVPDFGSVGVGASDVHTDRFFFTYSTFTQPNTLYLSEEDGTVREVRRMPEMFDAEGLEVSQHRATSKDGTQIPYFLVHDADLEMDGENPTLLSAYGGFNISRRPGYSGTVGKAWLERGGVYAVANIRGGGEYGPDWWKAAQLENRQRAFDDFIAVAEDLIERGITSPDHLGIQGGSNGGLLVGVAMTQRPDLFDAVLVDVPLLDMKRYNKLLAGASWMAEYGNPDTDDWEYIKEYSPYQNVHADQTYPRALFSTTTRDDRVHPGHARKMAHKMLDQGHPILYYENIEGGHGSGVTPEQTARMYAIRYTYLHMMLGPDDEVADATD
ncbi:MAG TPA: prolyl oligopeptidase family serine peptidase [Longimicrobiales bacterium]|nr:prolyl oligopeptidase family serine peptidase [Longimicrobiales bacterium]